MTMRAVILIPSQGKHVQQFLWSARAVENAVYRGHALIVQIIVSHSGLRDPTFEGLNNYRVELKTERGKPFSFGDHHNLSTMMTISHGAALDGPNLAAGAGGFQPWAAYDPFGRDGNPHGGAGGPTATAQRPVICSPEAMSCSLDLAIGAAPPRRPFVFSALRPRAREFWSRVGQSLDVNGKIVMLGCNLGRDRYIDHVANASMRPTYGPTTATAAADVNTVVRIVGDIERGLTPGSMRRAVPER